MPSGRLIGGGEAGARMQQEEDHDQRRDIASCTSVSPASPLVS
jgi:hypothetical protein